MLERIQDAPADTLAVRASGTVVASDVGAALDEALSHTNAATGLAVPISTAIWWNWHAVLPAHLSPIKTSCASLSSPTRTRWRRQRSRASTSPPCRFASSRCWKKRPLSSGLQPRGATGSPEGRTKPYRPPETVTMLPVTKLAAGDMSHAAVSAISSGAPTRRSGVMAAIRCCVAGSARSGCVISVAIMPGAMALTRMPSRPTSFASPRVKLSIAPFDAA